MIYLDNASTTKIKPEVIDVMTKSMKEVYGNPSSTHSIGRKAKSAIENSRNSIAKLLKCKAKEIIFTSGGTEADNDIIFNAINNLGVTRIISSPLEHHAVLDTLNEVKQNFGTEICLLGVNKKGEFNYDELEELLQSDKKTFVSLMHVNNEIGNITDIDIVGELCYKYKAIFHSDTTQGMTHFDYDLSKTKVDFICASAHKFGGPKGVGFLFKRDGIAYKKQSFGGEQERNFRSGTENIHGILGLQAAMEISFSDRLKNEKHITGLKKHLIDRLNTDLSEVKFNGLSGEIEKSVPKILNINMAFKNERMLVFQFDLKGIAISEGSACSAGNNKGSHVLRAINKAGNRSSIRVSFSYETTYAEIDKFIEVLEELAQPQV